MPEEKPILFARVKHLFMGGARDVTDPAIFHKMSLIAFFAWVGLGSDGLSSSCYGPEEAFLTLGQHTSLGIFVAVGTVITIFIIAASYSQIIELFPSGGGGYLVASKLLSPSVGMVSGCALLIDYVLTITLSIASGTDALFSFFPGSMIYLKMTVAVTGLCLLTWLNMRGVRESVLPLVPVFIIFIAAHAATIVWAIAGHSSGIPELVSSTAQDAHSTATQLGTTGMILLVLRAYSMGAGTFTGIEAVSNGIPVLRDPKIKTAKRTMRYMAWSLAFMVLGLMISYLLYGVEHVPGKTLNAVLFYKMTAAWGRWGHVFVIVTLFSEALLLFVAAQTGFLDGPRILSNMALDRWAPTRFAALNDRLVTQNGVFIMGVSSLALLLYSSGSVRFLVVLYSINVFVTFTLSQLGMVRHWWQVRHSDGKWIHGLLINSSGLVLTSFILVSVVMIKFDEGGWFTIVITGALVILAVMIKRHYSSTGKLLAKFNSLLELERMDAPGGTGKKLPRRKKRPVYDPEGDTAVLFVNGFTGIGLHSLLAIIRMFKGKFSNFVFIQVGVVDSGTFKGHEELENLEAHTKQELERYVEFMLKHGYYAESSYSIGVEIVDASFDAAMEIMKRHNQAVFFAGQLVFPEDSFVTRFLHNYSAFALQRKFYRQGIPFMVLPMRV
ncbi:MAG TPA: APC family permease [Spirochaetota bacterium]|nr:APC family permease [Spirochaetota bacterium]